MLKAKTALSGSLFGRTVHLPTLKGHIPLVKNSKGVVFNPFFFKVQIPHGSTYRFYTQVPLKSSDSHEGSTHKNSNSGGFTCAYIA